MTVMPALCCGLPSVWQHVVKQAALAVKRWSARTTGHRPARGAAPCFCRLGVGLGLDGHTVPLARDAARGCVQVSTCVLRCE